MPRVSSVATLLLTAGLCVGQSFAEDFARGQIVDQVPCTSAPIPQTYALYLPTAYSKERRWPVLYLFDARQHGAMAAEVFREAAERYGYIIVSSNYSRSDEGSQFNLDAMKAMWEDSVKRFAVDEKRLYASGYSGGARAACVMGRGLPGSLVGVIGCSGGFPEDWPPSKEAKFAFYGTAGTRDFNYPELERVDRELEALGLPHQIAIFDGGHEWPPVAEATVALGWMELRAMRDGLRPTDPVVVKRIYDSAFELARAHESAGAILEAQRRYERLAADFAGLTETAEAQRKSDEIKASKPFEKAVKLRDRLAREEDEYLEHAKEVAAVAFGPQGQMPLPQVLAELKIAKLKDTVRKHPNEPEGLSAQRRLNTIRAQTGFYLPRTMMQRKDYAHAALCYAVAAEIEPEEPTRWYNLACAHALAGKRKPALEALEKAAEAGFKDVAHLEADPDLASLRDEPGYRKLVEKLRQKG